MIKYLIIIILFSINQIVYAEVNQPLSRAEQLIELKKIDNYYKSQNQSTPEQVIKGITDLEKELGIEPIKQLVIIANKPKTKTVCKKVKNKSGKYVNQCKTVKVREKYKGKPVPNYSKK